MSNYRRLISYIYAYEGGVKGKNIGFAKIEVRGEQCRIYVSVKKIYVGSNDIGVYLLAPSDEILLGRIFVRGGTGEFRMNVNSSNIEGSGCAMEACYGLTIHDVESTWQCYTTIWEDAVTQAAETTLADVTSENVRKQDVEKAQEVCANQEVPLETSPPQFPISEEIERELDAEEKEIEAMAPWQKESGGEQPEPSQNPVLAAIDRMAQVVSAMAAQSSSVKPSSSAAQPSSAKPSASAAQPVSVKTPASAAQPVSAKPSASAAQPSSAKPSASAAQPVSVKTPASAAQPSSAKPSASAAQPALAKTSASAAQPVSAVDSPQPASESNTASAMAASTQPIAEPVVSAQESAPAAMTQTLSAPDTAEQVPPIQSDQANPQLPPEPEDTARLRELDRQEQEELSRNHLWNRLQHRYTKVLAFDYDNGCEILSIKPQDIGLLPREIWVYGNNSFLLHGYYNYRHLILARLNNPKGEPRYLLGVPGHYFSNEKYMASMFGFPHFVLARRQPENDGRFGYWYTDIRL